MTTGEVDGGARILAVKNIVNMYLVENKDLTVEYRYKTSVIVFSLSVLHPCHCLSSLFYPCQSFFLPACPFSRPVLSPGLSSLPVYPLSLSLFVTVSFISVCPSLSLSVLLYPFHCLSLSVLVYRLSFLYVPLSVVPPYSFFSPFCSLFLLYSPFSSPFKPSGFPFPLKPLPLSPPPPLPYPLTSPPPSYKSVSDVPVYSTWAIVLLWTFLWPTTASLPMTSRFSLAYWTSSGSASPLAPTSLTPPFSNRSRAATSISHPLKSGQ